MVKDFHESERDKLQRLALSICICSLTPHRFGHELHLRPHAGGMSGFIRQVRPDFELDFSSLFHPFQNSVVALSVRLVVFSEGCHRASLRLLGLLSSVSIPRSPCCFIQLSSFPFSCLMLDILGVIGQILQLEGILLRIVKFDFRPFDPASYDRRG